MASEIRTLLAIPPTPLVRVVLGDGPPIWCKLDFLNPSGSTKDRIARYILGKAWRQGRLHHGDSVVEASSGSTSIAMAMACAQLGIRFVAVIPEGVSNERVLIIRAYGGEVVFTPKDKGVCGSIEEAERTAGQGCFLPRQFSNPDNAEAHRVGTAREIIDQIPGGLVRTVVSGVGTGGTLVGLCEGFVEMGCRVIAVHARPINVRKIPEAECCSFSGRIPGVVDHLSTIFQPDRMEDLRTIEVEDDCALDTTRQLIRMGYPVGPSSGLNVAAAIGAWKAIGEEALPIVTVFPDRMERYFTTELFRPFAS